MTLQFQKTQNIYHLFCIKYILRGVIRVKFISTTGEDQNLVDKSENGMN